MAKHKRSSKRPQARHKRKGNPSRFDKRELYWFSETLSFEVVEFSEWWMKLRWLKLC